MAIVSKLLYALYVVLKCLLFSGYERAKMRSGGFRWLVSKAQFMRTHSQTINIIALTVTINQRREAKKEYIGKFYKHFPFHFGLRAITIISINIDTLGWKQPRPNRKTEKKENILSYKEGLINAHFICRFRWSVCVCLLRVNGRGHLFAFHLK